MRTTILGIVALVFGLPLTMAASAHEPHSQRGPARSATYVRKYHGTKPYHVKHGRAYGAGYYYPGRNHDHWERRVWSQSYRRYHYYDSYLHCYYYYCPKRGGYYPVP